MHMLNYRNFRTPKRNNKLPATTKLRDQVGGAVGERHARVFFFVSVTRNSRAQQVVCSSQPVGKRAKHFQCDVGISAHEIQKRVARENREAFEDSPGSGVEVEAPLL